MAKPNPQDPLGRKKAEPVQEQEEELEVDAGEKDANDTETQQSEHNTLGNAAIQSQMIAPDDAGAAAGEGGGGGGLSMRRAMMDSEVAYGGDGDGGGDLPLTLEDLVRSWNPATTKTKDRPSWLEPMPTDELPPEDAAYLAEVRAQGPTRVTAGFTLAAQVQPSASVVASSLIDWCNEAMNWCGSGLLERSMAYALRAGSSFLQDPDGRILLTRARMAAATNQLLLGSPGISGTTSTEDVAFLMFCLELAGHRRHAEMVRIDPGVEGKQMPKSHEVFDRCFQGPEREVVPRALGAGPNARLQTVLLMLFDMEDPGVYLPALQPVEPVEVDDPLGLDALMAEMTGGKKDPEDALYYSALQAAERIAAATARTRVHTAAVAVSIAQVAKQWSSGAPTATLRAQCRTLDAASDKSLRLLVEIARAAQKRNVPPRGLKAGLTRATRGLRKVHQTTMDLLAEVVGGVLPGAPNVLPGRTEVNDPLAIAWLDGRPSDALSWLESLPPTPENRAALWVTQACAGRASAEVGEPLLEVAKDLSPELRRAVEVFAGPCLLAAGQHGVVLALCESHLETATATRNGALLANAAMMGMDASDDAHARELWLRAGKLAFNLGAPGALTMLARYTPVGA